VLGGRVPEESTMIGLILLALVVWLVLAVIGFVVKGLFWLAIVGIVLFLITGVLGATRRRTAGR
jgi:pilus assembly protein TadC